MAEALKAVEVSVYLDPADQWNHHPLYLEMLKCLGERDVAGAIVLDAVAGFRGRVRIKTSSLVDAGGKPPFLLTFIDTGEHAREVLPHIQEMGPHRLIVSKKVTLESGEIE